MKHEQDDLINQALLVLEKRMKYATGELTITCPQDAKNYAKLKLSECLQEVFAVMFFDTSHSLLGFEEMFYGTIDGASVYPREIVRRCLEHNAAAIIILHNHPSGNANPSVADIRITKRIQEALTLFDIRLLDHLIVGREVTSMAEAGEM